MPFHSTPRLTIPIFSESGKLTFKSSRTNAFSYSMDHGADSSFPKIASSQRLAAGEMLDARAWHFEENTDEEILKCAPGTRMFQLMFEGNEYTHRLSKRGKDYEPALNLYRSIISEETIRFTIAMGESLSVLNVKLGYELIRRK